MENKNIYSVIQDEKLAQTERDREDWNYVPFNSGEKEYNQAVVDLQFAIDSCLATIETNTKILGQKVDELSKIIIK